MIVGAIAAGTALWPSRGSITARARETTATLQGSARTVRTLDVAAFRAALATHVRRAEQLRVREQAAPDDAEPGEPERWPLYRAGVLPGAGHALLSPCVLGPGKLCASLASVVERCDAGRGDDCMVVGTFLSETPPRPLIASVFFVQACRAGDAAGCERLEQINTRSSRPCEEDPFACAWQANDDGVLFGHERLDDACSLGVADSCATLARLTVHDLVQGRAYLETACQIGNPRSCEELAHRLSQQCDPDDATRVCYAPDDDEAREATAIACAAGFGAGCE